MKHKHHIIPRHAGGTNDPSNLVELTLEEHAEAHRRLFLQNGKLQDKLAWLMLSGKTSDAELVRVELANLGHKEWFSSIKSDPVAYQNWKDGISIKLTGKIQSTETKTKRSNSLKLAHANNPGLAKLASERSKQHSDKYRQAMFDGLSEKMAAARKISALWHAAVRSSEAKEKRINNSPKRREVIVNGFQYRSLREAARNTGIHYNKLQAALASNTDSEFVRFA